MLSLCHVSPEHPAARWLSLVWEWPAYYVDVPKEHILPHGMAEVVWNLTRPHRFQDHRGVTCVPNATLIGPRDVSYQVDTSTPSHLFGFLFQPGVVASFLGTSLLELEGRFTPLELFPRGAELVARVGDAHSAATRLHAVLAYFASLPEPCGGAAPQLVMRAWHSAQGRRTSIAQLRASLGISAPTFVHHVRHHLGLRPAQLRQVIMFRSAVEHLAVSKQPRVLTALNVGYCDQAHLNRAFRRHGGITPGQFHPAIPEHPFHLALP